MFLFLTNNMNPKLFQNKMFNLQNELQMICIKDAEMFTDWVEECCP